jgi:hypothetical protein
MAIISTRQSEDDDIESKAIKGLIEILDDATMGTIGNHPRAMIQAGTDIDTLLENVRIVLEVQQAAGQALFNDLMILSHEAMVLSVKYAEAMEVLDSLMNVSYDEALDHAAADLMDAFIASGAAEADHSGDLVFDARVAMKKSDVKPVLREAIMRWIELKIS